MIQWTDPATLADTTFEAVAGEDLTVEERLVVSPCDGRLRLSALDERAAAGEYVLEGQVVGSVAAPGGKLVPIHSRFAGWAMGFMVPDGCPVRCSEPVLWLRKL
ncbi:MAG: hypothetical protein ACRDJF_02705 [Actinomycetota bacterium]